MTAVVMEILMIKARAITTTLIIGIMTITLIMTIVRIIQEMLKKVTKITTPSVIMWTRRMKRTRRREENLEEREDGVCFHE